MWKRAITTIEVPTTLAFHPYEDVAGLVNKINSDAITLGNLRFEPFTLRFDGARVKGEFGSASGINYFTSYKFTALDEGHYRQYAVKVEGGWETNNLLAHDTAPFLGAFPFNPQ